MADQQKTTGRSRRARRREQAKAESGAGAVRPSAADDREPARDEAEAGGDQDEGELQSEAVAPAEQRRRRGGDVARSRNKKQRRRARRPQDDEQEELERIRDRNRQVRERAAATRRSRKQERSAAVAQGLDTGEMVDDALARSTHAAFQWIRRHFNTVQWVVVLAVAASIGWQIYSWRSTRTAEKESDQLLAAVAAENGQVGSGQAPAQQPSTDDERPRFASDDARLAAAAEAYVEAADGSEGAATTILGRLGLAGVLFDQGRFEEAIPEYQAVKDSELAKHDPDVKGRSLEGIGLCLEGKKDIEGALRVFRELENTETSGFVSLARYHQARLLHATGKQKQALELVKQAREKLSKDRSADEPPGYLEIAVRELQHTIDPASAAVAAGMGPDDLVALREQMRALQELVARQKPDLDKRQLEELMKDPDKVQKLLEDLGKLPGSLAPGAPSATPAPTGSQ